MPKLIYNTTGATYYKDPTRAPTDRGISGGLAGLAVLEVLAFEGREGGRVLDRRDEDVLERVLGPSK